MKTRTEIAALSAGLVIACLIVAAPSHSQPAAKVARIGFLSLPPHMPSGEPARAVGKALQDLGYVDGKTAIFDYRYGDWQPARLTEQAADLVRQRTDVIVAITNIPGFAAREATDRVPIVVWGIHGAVETGLVRTLARPGGNVTGIESLAPELDAKRLELIKQIAPKLARLGVVYNADDQGAPVHLLSMRESARKLGVGIVPLALRRPADFDRVLSGTAGASVDGVLMFTDDLTASNWDKVIDFTTRYSLPTVCELRFLVQLGCLVSYGPSTDEFTVRVAQQVARILKGAKPGDLPVEQATRFELLINKRTANSLGIAIPPSVLLKADEVIQ